MSRKWGGTRCCWRRTRPSRSSPPGGTWKRSCEIPEQEWIALAETGPASIFGPSSGELETFGKSNGNRKEGFKSPLRKFQKKWMFCIHLWLPDENEHLSKMRGTASVLATNKIEYSGVWSCDQSRNVFLNYKHIYQNWKAEMTNQLKNKSSSKLTGFGINT